MNNKNSQMQGYTSKDIDDAEWRGCVTAELGHMEERLKAVETVSRWNEQWITRAIAVGSTAIFLAGFLSAEFISKMLN